ncbi:MAG TPA: tRNA (N6-threonylcarbamoyladenosine(37)-N6)-methyltransferase TrmO [Candidatus Limiplasma sp.]|nr:tRNA (N6-threonylcarbamoyladenosine(37)-N6)-methyltransferase TrmO [Candidatus Limiplasma sp.]HPS81867.1 tRNA (N6-threonylcarbamoyladenosine(37)-N6)-methyltransferase TrmO [Candidatus Limiplasma sp.]
MKQKPPETACALKIIARIHNDFPTKFGLPRQSGLIDTLPSIIVFEPAYRNPDALRGLSGYTHLWLLWGFAGFARDGWSPMVRPPRLGGNERIGVFATRSPNRPNPIGLSCVRLAGIQQDPLNGDVLSVTGADLMDGSPIFDIKPYLPYTDSHPEAKAGFTDTRAFVPLTVEFAPQWLSMVPPERRETLLSVLASDPRPAYQDDPNRMYGFTYAGLDIRFTVAKGALTVREVVRLAL